jgi:hypothetical protein
MVPERTGALQWIRATEILGTLLTASTDLSVLLEFPKFLSTIPQTGYRTRYALFLNAFCENSKQGPRQSRLTCFRAVTYAHGVHRSGVAVAKGSGYLGTSDVCTGTR